MSIDQEPGQQSDVQFLAAVARLKRISRFAGPVSLVGAAVALAAMGVSAWQVADLQTRVNDLHVEEKAATARIQNLRGGVQAEEDKRELAFAQLLQDNTAAAEQILGSPVIPIAVAAAPDSARTDTPRVYFQIYSRDQSGLYQRCAGALRDMGYRVPHYELVSRGPVQTQVRYFHAGEKAQAEALAGATQKCLGGAVTVVFLGRYKGLNPKHFEVWLAPPSSR